jgi:hypothetical protein
VSAEELDLLIHRHLDGTLSEEEAGALDGRLRSDPRARRRLAEMAFDHAQLRELLETGEAAKAPRTAGASRSHLLAAASILLAVAVALVVGPLRSAPPPPAPAPAKEAPPPKLEGFRGFRGRIFARVTERRDKMLVELRVGEVLGVRDGSLAEDPQSLVGRTVSVLSPRVREGETGPERDHVLYLSKVQAGQEVVLEVQHLDGSDFAVASLTDEQVDWARRDDRKKLRDGAKEAPKEGVKDPPKEK